MEVSVIINTFNNENSIQRCIQSVVNQTFVDFECVVIDDCSLDKTFLVCDNIIGKDNRFRIIQNETNLGCSLSRKIGLEHTEGRYVVFIDGDDRMERDYLEKMYGKAILDNADLVYCDYYEEAGAVVRHMPQHIDKKTKVQIIAAMASYDPLLVSSLWNKLIRRDLLLKTEFPTERYGEDMYISLQLAYYSVKTSYVPDALYHYWVNNSGSMCNNPERESERRLAMYDICKKILIFLETHYDSNELFEPYLSIRMNKTALRIFSDSVLRNKRDAFALYPSAVKYLFRKEVGDKLVTKLCFLMAMLYKLAIRHIQSGLQVFRAAVAQ